MGEELVRPHVVDERTCAVERWGDVVAWRTLISADRTPTTGLTVGTAQIDPGAPTEGACHRHAAPEVYYFVAGTGFVHMDGAAYPVAAGTAVYVPGNTWHFVTNTGPDPLRLIFVFSVDGFDAVAYEFPEDQAKSLNPDGGERSG